MKHRWLAQSTIVRELTKRGWRRFNGGPTWAAFHCDRDYDPCGVHVKLVWGVDTHELELGGRHLRQPAIHFRSYAVSLKSLADFDFLEVEVGKLRKLASADLD